MEDELSSPGALIMKMQMQSIPKIWTYIPTYHGLRTTALEDQTRRIL